MRRQKNLLIVSGPDCFSVRLGKRKLAGEHASIEIRHGHRMGMHIPTARRQRHQQVAKAATRRHARLPFLLGPVHTGGNIETVPVDELGSIRVVKGSSVAVTPPESGPADQERFRCIRWS